MAHQHPPGSPFDGHAAGRNQAIPIPAAVVPGGVPHTPRGASWAESSELALAFSEGSQLPPMAAAAGLPMMSGQLSSRVVDEVVASSCRVEERSHGWLTWRKEGQALLKLALPMMCTNWLGYSVAQVTILFLGRLGQLELSAGILATSLFNVTGLSVLTGFSAAMETLAGQAFGARNYRHVGVVLQRALLLVTVIALVLAGLWARMEGALVWARQDPDIAHMAAQYLNRLGPALWFVGLSEAFKRYLMAQGIVKPATYVMLSAFLFAPLANWLLVIKLGLGFQGAAWAVVAVQLWTALALAGVIIVRDVRRRGMPDATWHGWSLDALAGWGQYLAYALPSVLMLVVEWTMFELLIIFSGMLPDPQVSMAAMGITINTSGMVFMLFSGLSQALSIRVSNSLGAGCPKVARRATIAAQTITLALVALVMTAVMLARHSWPRLFTDIPAVIETSAALMPLFALSQPGDATNAVLQGLLRGGGGQHKGATANVLSYWCFGVPLSAYLAFNRGLGVAGLWWGLVAVNYEQGLLMSFIALRFNFGKAADKAVARFGTGVAEPLLNEGSREGYDP